MTTRDGRAPDLHDLAVKYASDRLYWHSYLNVYQTLLESIQVRRMLIIGIGYEALMQPFLPEGVKYVNGGGLYMWRDAFPNAEIYGCDIQKDTLINEGRVHSIECDQSKPEDLKRLIKWSGGKFDI